MINPNFVINNCAPAASTLIPIEIAEKVRALSVHTDDFGKSPIELIKSAFLIAWAGVLFSEFDAAGATETGVALVGTFVWLTALTVFAIDVVTTCVDDATAVCVATGATLAAEATAALTLGSTLTLVTTFAETGLVTLEVRGVALTIGAIVASEETLGV